MAKPRWATFRESEPFIAHSVSRGVRRLPILEMPERRDWIERRLVALADAFAVDVLEWAAIYERGSSLRRRTALSSATGDAASTTSTGSKSSWGPWSRL